MALAYSAVGAAQTFTTGATSLTVPFPTVGATGICLLFVACKPDTMTISTPSGWNAPASNQFSGGTGTQGIDTGLVRIAVFWKSAASDTGSVTVTVSTATNSSVWARIAYFTAAAGASFDVACSGGSDSTTGTAWSVTYGANPGLTAGDVLVTGLTIPTDTLPTFASDAVAAAGATFTQNFISNPTTAVGDDLGGRVASFTLTGTATAAPTHTITLSVTTTNTAGAEAGIRVRETFPFVHRRGPNYRR